MIRNRLSVLLAERGLKITRAAKDTGISRNTITATAQNDTEMIRLDTINKLCKYLNVTPCDFFEYEPFDIEFSLFLTPFRFNLNLEDYCIEFEKATFDMFMDITGSSQLNTVELSCSIIKEEKSFEIIPFGNRKLIFKVDFNDVNEKRIFLDTIYNKIVPTFHQDIYNNLKSSIKVAFEQWFKSAIDDKIHEELDPFSDGPLIENLEDLTTDFNIEVVSDVFKPF